MIERLNFYDIYGYLLPGLTFLMLMWLPFGLVTQRWPPVEWSPALVTLMSLGALVFGYVVGHILHGVAEQVFPPKVKVGKGKFRFPSDILLDKNDKTFSPELKKRLSHQILTRFDIDVSDAKTRDSEVRDRRRREAFFLCRRALIQKGIASYAEQFQGMYALMEGVTAACGLAAAYHLGWAVARFLPPYVKDWLPLLAIVMLCLLVAISFLSLIFKNSKYSAVVVYWPLVVSSLVLLVGLGSLLGSRETLSPQTSFLLFGVCLTSLFISLRCYGTYKEFARQFAETVYRDFCALELAPIGKDA